MPSEARRRPITVVASIDEIATEGGVECCAVGEEATIFGLCGGVLHAVTGPSGGQTLFKAPCATGGALLDVKLVEARGAFVTIERTGPSTASSAHEHPIASDKTPAVGAVLYRATRPNYTGTLLANVIPTTGGDVVASAVCPRTARVAIATKHIVAVFRQTDAGGGGTCVAPEHLAGPASGEPADPAVELLVEVHTPLFLRHVSLSADVLAYAAADQVWCVSIAPTTPAGQSDSAGAAKEIAEGVRDVFSSPRARSQKALKESEGADEAGGGAVIDRRGGSRRCEDELAGMKLTSTATQAGWHPSFVEVRFGTHAQREAASGWVAERDTINAAVNDELIVAAGAGTGRRGRRRGLARRSADGEPDTSASSGRRTGAREPLDASLPPPADPQAKLHRKQRNASTLVQNPRSRKPSTPKKPRGRADADPSGAPDAANTHSPTDRANNNNTTNAAKQESNSDDPAAPPDAARPDESSTRDASPGPLIPVANRGKKESRNLLSRLNQSFNAVFRPSPPNSQAAGPPGLYADVDPTVDKPVATGDESTRPPRRSASWRFSARFGGPVRDSLSSAGGPAPPPQQEQRQVTVDYIHRNGSVNPVALWERAALPAVGGGGQELPHTEHAVFWYAAEKRRCVLLSKKRLLKDSADGRVLHLALLPGESPVGDRHEPRGEPAGEDDTADVQLVVVTTRKGWLATANGDLRSEFRFSQPKRADAVSCCGNNSTFLFVVTKHGSLDVYPLRGKTPMTEEHSPIAAAKASPSRLVARLSRLQHHEETTASPPDSPSGGLSVQPAGTRASWAGTFDPYVSNEDSNMRPVHSRWSMVSWGRGATPPVILPPVSVSSPRQSLTAAPSAGDRGGNTGTSVPLFNLDVPALQSQTIGHVVVKVACSEGTVYLLQPSRGVNATIQGPDDDGGGGANDVNSPDARPRGGSVASSGASFPDAPGSAEKTLRGGVVASQLWSNTSYCKLASPPEYLQDIFKEHRRAQFFDEMQALALLYEGYSLLRRRMAAGGGRSAGAGSGAVTVTPVGLADGLARYNGAALMKSVATVLGDVLAKVEAFAVHGAAGAAEPLSARRSARDLDSASNDGSPLFVNNNSLTIVGHSAAGFDDDPLAKTHASAASAAMSFAPAAPSNLLGACAFLANTRPGLMPRSSWLFYALSDRTFKQVCFMLRKDTVGLLAYLEAVLYQDAHPNTLSTSAESAQLPLLPAEAGNQLVATYAKHCPERLRALVCDSWLARRRGGRNCFCPATAADHLDELTTRGGSRQPGRLCERNLRGSVLSDGPEGDLPAGGGDSGRSKKEDPATVARWAPQPPALPFASGLLRLDAGETPACVSAWAGMDPRSLADALCAHAYAFRSDPSDDAVSRCAENLRGYLRGCEGSAATLTGVQRLVAEAASGTTGQPLPAACAVVARHFPHVLVPVLLRLFAAGAVAPGTAARTVSAAARLPQRVRGVLLAQYLAAASMLTAAFSPAERAEAAAGFGTLPFAPPPAQPAAPTTQDLHLFTACHLMRELTIHGSACDAASTDGSRVSDDDVGLCRDDTFDAALLPDVEADNHTSPMTEPVEQDRPRQRKSSDAGAAPKFGLWAPEACGDAAAPGDSGSFREKVASGDEPTSGLAEEFLLYCFAHHAAPPWTRDPAAAAALSWLCDLRPAHASANTVLEAALCARGVEQSMAAFQWTAEAAQLILVRGCLPCELRSLVVGEARAASSRRHRSTSQQGKPAAFTEGALGALAATVLASQGEGAAALVALGAVAPAAVVLSFGEACVGGDVLAWRVCVADAVAGGRKAAVRALLARLVEVLSLDGFLSLLPRGANARFFLPFVAAAVRRHESAVLAKEIAAAASEA
ncbi:hypothetical protein DIPPA_20102 [Diplonema papillatum]|nr:hypothetical protein DIPPA_20102 [Diplonema papillatum]